MKKIILIALLLGGILMSCSYRKPQLVGTYTPITIAEFVPNVEIKGHTLIITDDYKVVLSDGTRRYVLGVLDQNSNGFILKMKGIEVPVEVEIKDEIVSLRFHTIKTSTTYCKPYKNPYLNNARKHIDKLGGETEERKEPTNSGGWLDN